MAVWYNPTTGDGILEIFNEKFAVTTTPLPTTTLPTTTLPTTTLPTTTPPTTTPLPTTTLPTITATTPMMEPEEVTETSEPEIEPEPVETPTPTKTKTKTKKTSSPLTYQVSSALPKGRYKNLISDVPIQILKNSAIPNLTESVVVISFKHVGLKFVTIDSPMFVDKNKRKKDW